MTLADWSGGILIDKPAGITSHDLVFKIRKILKTPRVGHTGTLDPMATGLMLVLVGEAVKLSNYVTLMDKSYEAEFILGAETDTWDSAGRVLSTNPVEVKVVPVIEAAMAQSGLVQFPVPLFSAKKVDGKKLYEIARSGSAGGVLDTYEGPIYPMNFWDIKINSIDNERWNVSFSCSKGSFVRSWIYKLGRQLGTGAHMTQLRRTGVDRHSVTDATSLDILKNEVDLGLPEIKGILSIESLIDSGKKIDVDAEDAQKLKNGLISYSLQNRLSNIKLQDSMFCFLGSRLVAILTTEKGLKVARVFNL